MAPQGWKGEYDGWDPAAAWARTVELARAGRGARASSRSGCSTTSTRCPTRPTRSPSSRSRCSRPWRWSTERVRLGHMVVCTGFRNPALTAKMSSTIDVISGGRFELGIGAGWKEDEWRAYGYGFPPIGRADGRPRRPSRGHPGDARAGSRDLRGRVRAACAGRSTCRRASRSRASRSSSAATASNVTSGYAVKYADELNLVYPVARRGRRAAGRSSGPGARQIDRDPATLRVSLYSRDDDVRDGRPGAGRHCWRAFAALGLDRIVCFPTRWDRRSRLRPASPRTAGPPAWRWLPAV